MERFYPNITENRQTFDKYTGDKEARTYEYDFRTEPGGKGNYTGCIASSWVAANPIRATALIHQMSAAPILVDVLSQVHDMFKAMHWDRLVMPRELDLFARVHDALEVAAGRELMPALAETSPKGEAPGEPGASQAPSDEIPF